MIVYKATNKINNMIYIGCTTYSLERRIHGHLHCGKRLYFQNALRKHPGNFTWEILATVETKEDMFKLEQMYIKLYRVAGHKLYNLTDGGEGHKVAHTEDTRCKITESNCKSHGTAIEVYKDGELIGRYSGIKPACRALGITNNGSGIRARLSGKIKQHRGFTFKRWSNGIF